MSGFDLTDKTHFMNVDLDVLSRSPLDPLAAAFGKSVSVLYVGSEGRLYGAHFELAHSYNKNADALIRGFVALVGKLPSSARKLWNGARSRDFNIGIQSAAAPVCHELRLRAETLGAVARLGGSIVITTYAPVVQARARVRKPAGTVRRTAERG